MTREELISDIAYARALAEEGRQAPLLGGSYLTFWGVLNAVAYIAHWAALTERLPILNGLTFAVIWAVYGMAAGIGMFALHQRVREKPGCSAIGVRAERAIWSGATVAIFVIVAGSLARMIMTNDSTAPNAIFGAAFAIFGAAMFAVATLSLQVWMRRFAWLSASIALALCLFANEDWAYLYAAIGSLLALAWPGILLLKREPSAIV
jgi:hypothetical protein